MNPKWIGAALVVLLAVPCCAADSPLEPPDLERYVRWGPLRARPGFELANLGYDDNIFANNNEVVGDYVATVFGRLDGLLLLGSRAFLVFREKLGYTAYFEFTDQNYPVQRGSARVTWPVRGFGLFAEGVLNRDTTRPVDRQDIRPRRAEDRLGVGIILEPGWRTTVELSRRATRWGYSDPDGTLVSQQTIGERLNRDEVRTTLAARYELLGRTSLTFDAFLGTIDFESLSPLGRTKNSDEWGVLPGVAFGEGGSLTGGLTIGWQRIRALDPLREDFSGWVGDAELAYRPVRRATLRLTGRRTPGFTVANATTYYLDTRVGLSLLYYLNRTVGLEGGAGTGTVTFPDRISFRRDEIQRYNLAVVLRLAESSIGRRVEYRVNLQHYDRTSNVPSQNLTRTQLGLSASVGF